ncbi:MULTISPECIES: nucleotidyltransferase domain-containing protein [unclassified Paenibacillus]|uniref:Nucleotidyltransferase domain-containing protein n=1 Tax=Paenibacillus provencensis TaxID=441151 RepID=A0ABW3PSJ7_9BACL|nr:MULTISPECIES: nucleotidyltransferase domain-containing protein [unclassified Paenibacillus]MCM3127841.1 nucleotidyltransferase domain-containing protein [Paenibacillus sp. MER 78]SFS37213.1 Nucleotidyltransferase domain-containing protein [Paenibacillus sp. 453mf]
MEITSILNKVTTLLSHVPGIVGIVLGGSRARGTHHTDSDIDIGIYYDLQSEFSIDEINKAVKDLNEEPVDHPITPIGGWGPWVNAGGWFVVDGCPVDLILRDMERVEQVIQDCLAGKINANYQPGHPHAYINGMYLGELAISHVLHDPEQRLASIKQKIIPYPTVYKQSMIDYFSFEASFSHTFVHKYAAKDDSYYVMGHVFRSLSCLNQILFAINEEHCINEKRAVQMIEDFDLKPAHYKQRVDEIVELLSPDPHQLALAAAKLQSLIEETNKL